MNNILFITNKENFQIFSKEGVLGFKQLRKNYALKTHPGDQVACYIGGIGKVGGIFKIESEMYEDREKVFTMKTKDEIYPWRFKVSTVKVLPEERWIPIEEFKDKLSIFKKRAGPHWKLALQGQIHYLTTEDWQHIEDLLS
jgi:predicted RNA-binding protein